ncbi:hypothetical protein IV47_GL000829 [Lactobacillus delbrueckii subsp. bulgaricus ATCC 11842 = JCM 1002]|nr:hypothetical protein IV47_GL000829 [Lactobacillus delbrueckii subsp. bulgaricus ATCC 11842 = JCM 1002]
MLTSPVRPKPQTMPLSEDEQPNCLTSSELASRMFFHLTNCMRGRRNRFAAKTTYRLPVR